MNTDPNAKRILCYGDSNTHGIIPLTEERYPENMRWTGLLQSKLGLGYEIVEEGMSARTLDINDGEADSRNGKKYIIPCLKSQNPLELVVVMLGTCNLKERYDQTPEQVSREADTLTVTIKREAKSKIKHTPPIILISPALVDEGIKDVKGKYLGAEGKSKQLGRLYEEVARKNSCEFLDAANIVTPSKRDGLHLDPQDHQKLAEAVYAKIKLMGL